MREFETNYYKGIIHKSNPPHGDFSRVYIGTLYWKDTMEKACDFRCCTPFEGLIFRINNRMFVRVLPMPARPRRSE